MRLVVDTNVLLSGLIWSGPPRKLIDAAIEGEIEIVSSVALLEELHRTLSYGRIVSAMRAKGKQPIAIMDLIAGLAEIVDAPALPQHVCRDPDDDAVLACALAARADLIISGDDDLLVLATFEGIPIVTAASALVRIATR